MTEAGPPGVPDDFDITKIVGYQPPDLEIAAQRQHVLSAAYGVALSMWASMAFLTLCAFIFTGMLFFCILGYAVTVPYILVCYKHRNAIDYAAELDAWCKLDC